MALISFFSAKGAPGVTSTAMLTAALWPRQTLLVDADGTGGDLQMRLPNEVGTALTQHPGLLTLLPLARHGLAPGVVLDHSQVLHGGQRLLVGLETPEQSDAAGALWPTLARAFRELPGYDVIVDAGALSLRSGQLGLVQRGDLAVGVVRANPASVMHMRQRIASLHDTFRALGADAPRLGVVCVEDVQRQGEASSAVATIRAEVPDVLDLGQVALDARSERMFHGDPVSRPERTMLVRSGRTLVERLLAAVGPDLSPPAGAPVSDLPEPASDLETVPPSRRAARPPIPDAPKKRRWRR
ncbi:hypothetical protein [Ornithinimicrobium tianjinense]|uniref:MinD-like ATPase involved in chromosome partitioning or flagellar assembly n=1 Tax=Ornithinimicrobium tianjinense TaxID=1195761 RepID=A0A917BPL6_9MICO|nr:hypothetical protein [Ornithinimicrobium tianjinense]GGF54056.1 hypothetical protein GCM10011366_22340 [Ornithinimicrobium tianjinense]